MKEQKHQNEVLIPTENVKHINVLCELILTDTKRIIDLLIDAYDNLRNRTELGAIDRMFYVLYFTKEIEGLTKRIIDHLPSSVIKKIK